MLYYALSFYLTCLSFNPAIAFNIMSTSNDIHHINNMFSNNSDIDKVALKKSCLKTYYQMLSQLKDIDNLKTSNQVHTDNSYSNHSDKDITPNRKLSTTVEVSTGNEFQSAIESNVMIEVISDMELMNPIFFFNVEDVYVNGNNHQIDGQKKVLLFYIYGTMTGVTFNNITLLNGHSPNLGGCFVVYFSNYLSLINTNMMGHNCSNGCGVYGFTTQITIENCQGSNNNASQASGVLFTYNASLIVNNSTFVNNVARLYGSVLSSYESDQLVVTNSLFDHNHVLRPSLSDSQGGVMLMTSVDNVRIENSNFTSNSANSHGGAVIVLLTNTVLHNCYFSYNKVLYGASGGALLSYLTNLTITETTFDNNTAEDTGGGVRVYNTIFIVEQTYFGHNFALLQGGAGSIEHSESYIANSHIDQNHAGYNGGGMAVFESKVTFLNCLISSNVANVGGGGIYTSGYTTVAYFLDSHIFKNMAADSGAGMKITAGDCYLSNVLVNENTAVSSEFKMSSNSSEVCLTIGGCIYSGNYPLSYNNNEECVFEALSDGILDVQAFETQNVVDALTIDGTSSSSSYSNIIGPDGVSILKGDKIIWSTDSVVTYSGFEICFNIGAQGGGIYITGDNSYLEMINNSFIGNNTATRSGGGIFSESGSIYLEQTIISDNFANTKGFDLFLTGGTFAARELTIPNIATDLVLSGGSLQAAECISSCSAGYSANCTVNNDALNCHVNCECIPCPAGTSFTYDGSTSMSDCETCGGGQISSQGASECDTCAAGRYATDNVTDMDGGLYIQVIGGATYCNPCPAGFYSPNEGAFVCQACSAGKTSHTGSSNCSNCEAGKYSSAGDAICSDCSKGTYSDIASWKCTSCSNGYYSNKASSSCQLAASNYYISIEKEAVSCPSHSTCFGFDHLPVPDEGYWVDRTSIQFAENMFLCIRGSCKGAVVNNTCWSRTQYEDFYDYYDDDNQDNDVAVSNNLTIKNECDSDELQCLEGSEGPLCGSCSPHYIYKGEYNKCIECDRDTVFPIIFISLICLIWLVTAICYYFPQLRQQFPIMMKYLKFFSSFESGSLKVAWVTYQIVISIQWNIEIQFPSPFNEFYSYLSIFSFDFLKLECEDTEDSFFFTVYTWSILPLLLMLLFLIFFYIRILIIKFISYINIFSNFNYHNEKIKLEKQNLWYFICLTYLVLPPATMKQLQTFDCININNNLYLRSDTSINCESNYYYSNRTGVIILFCFYQFIPIYWMILLLKQKNKLSPISLILKNMNEEDEMIFLEIRDKNKEIDNLRFLFNDYKPAYWWFEIADMYRRILFIGILPLVSAKAATRACFGCILAFLSVIYFREEEPYRYTLTNKLAYIAQIVILITFYGALSIDTGIMMTFGLGYAQLGMFLFLVNLIVLSLVMLITFHRFQIDLKKSKWKRSLTQSEFQIVEEVMNLGKTSSSNFDNNNDNIALKNLSSSSTSSLLIAKLSSLRSQKSKTSISSSEKVKERPAQLVSDQSMQTLSEFLLPAKDIIMKKKLGAGAFGEVFKGTCKGEHVAIKTMLDVTEQSVKEFRSEILLTATLKHPNIVNFIGASWGRELICMVLEWVSKGSLGDFLEHSPNGQYRWNDPLLRLVTDIVRGMNYLHKREYYDEKAQEIKQCILHRDLKPDNVLVSEFIAGKLSDFGTSRAKELEDVIMTSVGTPLFVAPELMRGEFYDEKVDVYSFGLTLLMIAIADPIMTFIGKRWIIAFNKKKIPKQPMRLIRPMTEDGWRPVTDENPISFAPPTINSLIVRCCSHDPTQRPSFEEILDELNGICKEEIGPNSFLRCLVYDEEEISPHDQAAKEVKFNKENGTEDHSNLTSNPMVVSTSTKV